MSRKFKVLVAVIAAVVLLGIIGTATVMAQSPTETPKVKININARVAEILGISETNLNNAIKEAKAALSTQAATTTPATPMKPEKRTPFNAADLYAGIAEILDNGITAGEVEAAFQQAEKEARDKAIKNALDNTVANGKISQDEADQIEKWWQDRPAALDKLGMPFEMGPGGQGFGMGPGIKGFGLGPGVQGKNSFPGKMRGFGNCPMFPGSNPGASPSATPTSSATSPTQYQ
jgi:hypothetical protein